MTVGVTIGSLGIVARHDPRRDLPVLPPGRGRTSIQSLTGQNLWDPSVRFLTDLPSKTDPFEVTAIVVDRAGPVLPRDALSRRGRRRAPTRSRCCAMSEPVLVDPRPEAQLHPGRRHDRGAARRRPRRRSRARSSRCSARRARASRPCCRRSACSKAGSKARSGSPARKRPSSTTTAAPSCAATRSASSTSSTICCPTSTRSRMSSCRSWSAAPTPDAARARAEQLLGTLGLVAAARPPPVEAVGRRAAARRGRPRARQPAAAGPRRRADRQSRRGTPPTSSSPNS